MKFCGKRGSKTIYFKEELIALAVERLGISESSAKNKNKEELCKLLGLPDYKPLTPHHQKVCSAKKTKNFPNRYSKEELVEMIFADKRNRFTRSVLQKLKIKDLCKLARIPFVDIPPSGVRRTTARVNKQEMIVLPPRQGEGIIQTKERAGCVARSLKNPFPHQLKVLDHFQNNRGLIAVHSLGSGKTLTAVLSSQCYLDEHPTHRVIVVSPTTLIANFKKEMKQFGDLRHADRYSFYSFQGFYNKHKKTAPNCKNTFLIVDEAHNLRTQHKKTARKEVGKFNKVVVQCAKKANQVLLLTATPVVNTPGDIASLLDMVRNPEDKTVITSKDIDKNQKDEAFLRQIAQCKFSFYKVGRAMREEHYPRKEEISIYLPMPTQFLDAYNKVENLVMEDDVVMKTFGEAQLKPFFNGIRRAVNILSELPEEDLVKSPKVKWMIDLLKREKNKKTVIFSHFLDMGLKAIQKRLPANIRSDYITGSQSKTRRNEIVEQFNNNELDVLFISKAGGEGIDLKGTRRIILMEAGWNENTEKQVIGRGIRFGSHKDLPEEEKLVEVYHLYHIKPEEREQVKDLMKASKEKDLNDPKKFDEYTKKMLKEYNYKQNLKDPDLWLSADLMLKKISLDKQETIKSFLKRLRQLSIENDASC